MEENMAKMKIIENEEIDINLNINTDGAADDLEPIEGEDPLGELDEGMPEDYQYVITIEEKSSETTDAPEELVPDEEKEYEFVLKKYTGEEELETEFDEMEEIEGGFEEESPMPLESKKAETVLEAIDPATGMPMDQAPVEPGMAEPMPELEPIEDTELDPEEEITEETYTFTQDELIEFFNAIETDTELYLDEETKFDVEEVVDYLKLYPESEMMVKVQDTEAFDVRLQEVKEKEQEGLDDAGDELQTVEVGGDPSGAPAPGEEASINQPNATAVNFPMESFSILNVNNKKNIPDGIYIAALNESKVYGRFKSIKLLKNNLKLDGKLFRVKNDINLTEAVKSESTELIMESSEISKALLEFLEKKSELVLKL